MAWLALLLMFIFCGSIALVSGINSFLYETVTTVGLRKSGRRAMIALGSGGHTGEMFKLLKKLAKMLPQRVYVVSSGDEQSIAKMNQFEREQKGRRERFVSADYYLIKRIRDVGQNLLQALLFRLPHVSLRTYQILAQENPTILLCNGPGMCVAFGLWSWTLNRIGRTKTVIIYVESICRVESLSLTGMILIHVVDEIYVQWESLYESMLETYPKYAPKIKFVGRLS